MPFVLNKKVTGLLADIGRRAAELEVVFRHAQKEVGVRIKCAVELVKIELAVDEEIEHGVVLIGRVAGAELPVVASPHPGKGVRVRESIVDELGWALRAEPGYQSGGEAQPRGAGGLVGRDAHAQLSGRRQGRVRNGLVLSVALQGEMEFVEPRSAECVYVGEAGVVIVRKGGGREAWPAYRQRPDLLDPSSSHGAVDVVFF